MGLCAGGGIDPGRSLPSWTRLTLDALGPGSAWTMPQQILLRPLPSGAGKPITRKQPFEIRRPETACVPGFGRQPDPQKGPAPEFQGR